MSPLIWIKLIAESIIAVPKILAEIRDAYMYAAELIDETEYKNRKTKRNEIDDHFHDELKKRKPNAEKLRDLHRNRYRM